VDPRVVGELRVERGGDHRPVPNRDRAAVDGREYFDAFPTSSMSGARMNTAWNGSSSPVMGIFASKESFCLPNALRSTETFTSPSASTRSSFASREQTMRPAQVASTGFPLATCSRISSSIPSRRISREMVVDSPPGMRSTSQSGDDSRVPDLDHFRGLAVGGRGVLDGGGVFGHVPWTAMTPACIGTGRWGRAKRARYGAGDAER